MLAYAAVAVPDLPELESVLAEMKKQYPDLLKLGELLYANGLLEAGEVIRARERLDRLADPRRGWILNCSCCRARSVTRSCAIGFSPGRRRGKNFGRFTCSCC